MLAAGWLWASMVIGTLLWAPAAWGTRVRVLFFVATDCPYSNRYFPEMVRLEKEFAGRGVEFLWVYPNRGEQLEAAQAHQQTYGAPTAKVNMDADGKLTLEAGAHITPSAAVLASDRGGKWTVPYRGRIDDRYVRIGLERARVEHHDLENAVAAVLAGQPVTPAAGAPVGCAIVNRQR